jgi:fused signal recognition particle receptor
MQAAAKAKESWKKVQAIAKKETGVNAVKLGKVDDKQLNGRSEQPPTNEKVQVKSTMDVKTGNGLVVQVEAVKKPENANKLQELAAMEEALKKATEEAHKQRIALAGTSDSTENALNQSEETLQSHALQELKKQQDAQQQALLHQLDLEEKQRQAEIKQNEDLERKIAMAERERQQEEVLSRTRASELKKLQEEEAAQKLEAERMEQEFLAAQAVQETKAAAAKKAAAKANLARLKRKHELSRRKAEAQLQMLKVKQQMEAEQALELEK